jgi:hypothetical protein
MPLEYVATFSFEQVISSSEPITLTWTPNADLYEDNSATRAADYNNPAIPPTQLVEDPPECGSYLFPMRRVNYFLDMPLPEDLPSLSSILSPLYRQIQCSSYHLQTHQIRDHYTTYRSASIVSTHFLRSLAFVEERLNMANILESLSEYPQAAS